MSKPQFYQDPRWPSDNEPYSQVWHELLLSADPDKQIKMYKWKDIQPGRKLL